MENNVVRVQKNKNIDQRWFFAQFAGKKLYYTHFTEYSADRKKAVVYQCNVNGSGKKKLASFSAKDFLAIYNFTSKSCIIDNDEGTYQYFYAAKKKKKISNY